MILPIKPSTTTLLIMILTIINYCSIIPKQRLFALGFTAILPNNNKLFHTSLYAEQQQQQPKQEKQQKQKQKQKQQKKQSNNDDESDFITSRETDYSKWYNDIIRVTGLSENSPVRGCMIIKPWGMSLWNTIQRELDTMITIDHGAENVYFPLLIPQSFLCKEAEHVEGFATECAVVTHSRLKVDEETGVLGVDKDALLEEPLIIRPTSETMIWSTFKKWIKSYR